MKVIYGAGFTDKEIASFVDAVLSRTMLCVHTIIQATQDLSISTSPKLKDTMEDILQTPKLTQKVLASIEAILADKGIQEAFKRKHEFQLDSNAKYFFDNVRRFSAPDYIPTQEDIFKVRQKTSGISENTFATQNGLEVTLVDVGGQRSERRKWLHCFQDVGAVLYFISLDEYNLQLSEDYRVNRLQESLDLFEEITSSVSFKNKIHFFVLYNKNDLFKEKVFNSALVNRFLQVSSSPISDLFEEFDGKPTYNNTLKFIQNQFKSRFGGVVAEEEDEDTEADGTGKGSDKFYHSYVTCVLETEKVKDLVGKLRTFL